MLHVWKHLCVVTRHRWKVLQHCCRVGLIRQGLVHDLSKFSWTEFYPGARFYTGVRSPINDEREYYGYALSWLHHKGRNKHHVEYWTDYHPETKVFGGVPMPLRYVAESICDRMAASKTYLRDKYTQQYPLEFYLKEAPHLPVHPDTHKLFVHYLTILSEQGEDACFATLRADLRADREKRRTTGRR